MKTNQEEGQILNLKLCSCTRSKRINVMQLFLYLGGNLLFSTLTKLQDVTGRKSDFLFPKIIAVGNQSSGKSSIIQGLIGMSSVAFLA